MTIFQRYVGIDYSGAQTPNAFLTGLRIYLAAGNATPEEIKSPAGKYWNRRAVAEWLVEQLAEGPAKLVGIDHGFSFPLRYFETHGLKPDWAAFLDDFQRHWPTDEDHAYVDFVREGDLGNGAVRTGNTRWRRLAEEYAGGAKSVFHFDVPGSVAKSTHAGLPWLRFIRHRLGSRVHFWPFDGWDVPAGRSAIAEVYPGYEVTLWQGLFAPVGTPEAVVARLRREAIAVRVLPDVAQKIANAGAGEPWIATDAEFVAQIRADNAKFGKVIETIGAKVQ